MDSVKQKIKRKAINLTVSPSVVVGRLFNAISKSREAIKRFHTFKAVDIEYLCIYGFISLLQYKIYFHLIKFISFYTFFVCD